MKNKIDKDDWEKVTEIASEIANATFSEDDELLNKYTKEILEWLDHLENKYGTLPSILATRADYIDNTLEKLNLLKQAYRFAESQKDLANLTFISSSISLIYIEDLHDTKNGAHWLEKLKSCLENYYDDFEASEFERLSEEIKIL